MIGFVYLAELPSMGLLKIGFSRHPMRRMIALKSTAKAQVNLISTKPARQEDESAVLKKFSTFLSHGREWFFDAPEIRQDFPPSSYSIGHDHCQHVYAWNIYHCSLHLEKKRKQLAIELCERASGLGVEMKQLCALSSVSFKRWNRLTSEGPAPQLGTLFLLHSTLDAIEAERQAA